MTWDLRNVFPVGMPIDDFSVGGLRATLYRTPRRTGRRIILRDAHQRVCFDTDECYDVGNATNAIELWVVAGGLSYLPGQHVKCIDATNGAHFLEVGKVFVVESTQMDRNGTLRLNLVGMARAWEVERFERVETKNQAIADDEKR